MHLFPKKIAIKKPSKYILLCIRPIIRFMHYSKMSLKYFWNRRQENKLTVQSYSTQKWIRSSLTNIACISSYILRRTQDLSCKFSNFLAWTLMCFIILNCFRPMVCIPWMLSFVSFFMQEREWCSKKGVHFHHNCMLLKNLRKPNCNGKKKS